MVLFLALKAWAFMEALKILHFIYILVFYFYLCLRAFSPVIRQNFSKNNIFFQAYLRVEFCGISAVEELCKSLEAERLWASLEAERLCASLEAERWFKSLEAADGLWKSLDAEILCRKEVDLFKRYCECARLDLKHLLKGL